jgi:hypothetical protein
VPPSLTNVSNHEAIRSGSVGTQVTVTLRSNHLYRPSVLPSVTATLRTSLQLSSYFLLRAEEVKLVAHHLSSQSAWWGQPHRMKNIIYMYIQVLLQLTLSLSSYRQFHLTRDRNLLLLGLKLAKQLTESTYLGRTYCKTQVFLLFYFKAMGPNLCFN